jgi:hypothetical protein
VRCKGCQYSLANLTEPRCPECGRAFDPNEPSTFDSEPLENTLMDRSAWSLLVSLFLIFGVLVFFRYHQLYLVSRLILSTLIAALLTSLFSPLLLLPLALIRQFARRDP